MASPPTSTLGYWAGSEVTLTCSVTVNSSEHHAEIIWKRGGVVIAGDERVAVVSANESAIVYTSKVTFSGVSETSDSGDYICEVTARTGAYYSLPVSSESVTIVVQGMTLLSDAHLVYFHYSNTNSFVMEKMSLNLVQRMVFFVDLHHFCGSV